jgi:hypothetical protein
MKLRKHSEVEAEINKTKVQLSIISASTSARDVTLHLSDIYNSRRYLSCGYKNYPDFLAKYFKQMSKSQAYKQANAGRLAYFLEGRDAVGKYSVGAMEELLKVKDEQLRIQVWLKLKDADLKPTAKIIKELVGQLELQPSSPMKKTNESRIRDSSSEGTIITIFTKLNKNQKIRLLKRLRKDV